MSDEGIVTKVLDRLKEVRRIQKDFEIKGKQYPYWEGVVGQCSKEEHFLVDLLETLGVEIPSNK